MNKQLGAEIGISVRAGWLQGQQNYVSFAFTARMNSERHVSSIVPPVGYRPKPAVA